MLSKRKVLVVALCLIMIFVMLSTTVLAARPTEKIKYSSRSDATVLSNGVTAWVGTSVLSFGDTSGGRGYRAFYKFSLGGIKVSSIDWVELEFHISSSTVNGTNDNVAPFPNVGLGDVLVVPIDSYGGRPSGTTTYDSENISAPVVLIPASNTTVTSPVSVNVTDAVIAAITAGSHVAAFSVQTAVETDGDGEYDMWYFYTREAPADKRPRLIVHLKQ